MLGEQNCWENKNVGKSKLLGDLYSFKYTESVISRLRSFHWQLFRDCPLIFHGFKILTPHGFLRPPQPPNLPAYDLRILNVLKVIGRSHPGTQNITLE